MALVPNERSPAQDSYYALLIEIKELFAPPSTRRCVRLIWNCCRFTGTSDGSSTNGGETWARAVVENLAKDLRAEFPGVSGFSAANLWRIKQFYEAYAKGEKLAPLVREIRAG